MYEASGCASVTSASSDFSREYVAQYNYRVLGPLSTYCGASTATTVQTDAHGE
jgi:hypothetical protein